MKKIKVAVLFGGVSAEHEVSIESSKFVLENIDTKKFEAIPIKIEKDGEFDIRKLLESDIVFPVLHGRGGEDGVIQGLCESLNKKYVGCGVRAAALGMDKIAQKTIFEKLKIPTPPFWFFSKFEWENNSEKILDKFSLPVFIKPTNTGSSIGISKVKEKSEIAKAINEALQYDTQIIVECAMENIREIELAVLGNDDLVISDLGEIIPAEEFYTYDAKYKFDSGLVIPAKIDETKTNEIKQIAEKSYRALGCAGMARIDFFLEKPEGKIYINEINIIPGMTKNSMYPKLLVHSGINNKELITKLIELGLNYDQNR